MATPAPFARRRLGRRLSVLSVAVAGGLALVVAGAVGVAAAPTLHRSGGGTHATLTATAVLSVTAVCSPTPATNYLWQVGVTGQTETSYTVDYSATGGYPWTTGPSETTPSYSFPTLHSFGAVLYARLDVSHTVTAGPVAADTTACPTPTPTPTSTPVPTPTPPPATPTPKLIAPPVVQVAPGASPSSSPSALEDAFAQMAIPPAVAGANGVSLASAVLSSAGGIAFVWADSLILLAALVSLLLFLGPLRGRRLRRHGKQG